MLRTPPPFRHFRLALCLAWVAVVAHLGLGYVGAAHAARMLAAEADGWVVVCTPAGLKRITSDGGTLPPPQDGSPLDARNLHCVSCCVASVATAPAGDAPAQSVFPDHAVAPRTALPDRGHKRYAGIRPPPRAPPRFS